jgi:hypothetical protein
MSSRPPEEERFTKNAIQLVNAVHYGLQKLYDSGYKTVNPSLLLIPASLLQSEELNKHSFITTFINKSNTTWNKIKERDEDYFITNADKIFDLPENLIKMVKDLYLTKDANGNNIITQQFKNQIWDLLDAMIKTAIQYVYKKQQTDAKQFGSIKINHHIKVWHVKV